MYINNVRGHNLRVTVAITVLAILSLAGGAGAISQPTAITLTPTNISSTSATLMGSVNPNGLDTEVDFASGAPAGAANDWGISPLQNIGSGASPVAVSYTLTGLVPGTTYSYAVRATNNIGSLNGAVVTFTTPTTSSPTATTLEAIDITPTSATLSGSVNPNGLATRIDFASADPSGSSSYFFPPPIQNIGSGISPVEVNYTLTGLTPGTTYSYRIRATNSAGSNNGGIVSFTTPSSGDTPTAITLAPANITSTSAVLRGSVNPNGLFTEIDFASGALAGAANDWGISPLQNIGSGTSSVEVNYTLTGLVPGTTYSYAVRATNNVGSQNGAVVTFTTPATSSPAASTLDATNITPTSVTLSGSVNPNGLATRVDFASEAPAGAANNWGISTLQNIGSGTSPVEVNYTLTGLTPGTTYSYRIRATNSAGSNNGGIVSFTTLPAGDTPTATTLAPANITSTSATLRGSVNPNGLATDVDFASGAPAGAANDWGISPLQNIGGATSPVAVSYTLTGLTPGTDYSYAVRATNNAGSQNGALVSFTTLPQVAYTLSAAPTTVSPGERITVTFTAPGYETDWIAIYSINADNADYGEWFYIEGRTRGTLTFEAPSEAGDYEFRLFQNWPDGGYDDIARSNRISVTGVPPVTVVTSTGSVVRSISPSSIQPGGSFNITLAPSPSTIFDSPGYQVIETIPQGFVFVSTSAGYTFQGNVYNFTQIGSEPIIYTLIAPDNGSYTISGTFLDDLMNTGIVSGTTSIHVGGINYDTNGNGRIDRNEAVQAVADYFSAILTRQEAMEVVMRYFTG